MGKPPVKGVSIPKTLNPKLLNPGRSTTHIRENNELPRTLLSKSGAVHRQDQKGAARLCFEFSLALVCLVSPNLGGFRV